MMDEPPRAVRQTPGDAADLMYRNPRLYACAVGAPGLWVIDNRVRGTVLDFFYARAGTLSAARRADAAWAPAPF